VLKCIIEKTGLYKKVLLAKGLFFDPYYSRKVDFIFEARAKFECFRARPVFSSLSCIPFYVLTVEIKHGN